MDRLCEVFRSPKREGMYLYVDRDEGLSRVPEGLLASFGEPASVMLLPLNTQRRLARAKLEDVLLALEEKGFYLQMPPSALPYPGKPDGTGSNQFDEDTAC